MNRRHRIRCALASLLSGLATADLAGISTHVGASPGQELEIRLLDENCDEQYVEHVISELERFLGSQ